jgi:hypothetical protein
MGGLFVPYKSPRWQWPDGYCLRRDRIAPSKQRIEGAEAGNETLLQIKQPMLVEWSQRLAPADELLGHGAETY